MGKIINTRVSDYLSFSWSRIMNLLHVLLSWTWLPLTNLQASGSVWNSFQVGGIFFPWHFAAETAPSRKLRSVTLPNMSFLLPYILFPQEKKADAGQWELANENAATAHGLYWHWGNWSNAIFHTKKETILDTTGWNLCYARGRSLAVSFKLPSYFREIGLIFSRRH